MYAAIETLLMDASSYRNEPNDAIPFPYSCAVCGKWTEADHKVMWSSLLHEQAGDGMHLWVAPSQQMVLLRMLARRNLRDKVKS